MAQIIIMAIQVLPRMKDGTASTVIDKAVEVIKLSGVKYHVCPFETVMEGTYEKLMQVLEGVQQVCLKAGAEKVLVNVRIEQRQEGDITIEGVIRKYEE